MKSFATARKASKPQDISSYNPLARGFDEESDRGSNTSDSSYDEEENRRLGYISRMQYNLQNQKEIMRQQEQLRDYQNERSARAAMEREMEELKASLAEEEAWRWGDQQEDQERTRRAEEAAASLSQAMDQEEWQDGLGLAGAWAAHWAAWKEFDSHTPHIITMECVPWPPDCGRLLSAMALLEMQEAGGGGGGGGPAAASEIDAYNAHKRAFMRANLRWHPDKFSSKFGARLCDDLYGKDGVSHKEAISLRVQEIAQAINESWDHIQCSK